MQISAKNGTVHINGKEVLTVVFTNGETMRFPCDDANDIQIESGGDTNTVSIKGDRNVAISGKNISHGNVIHCGGDFRLGDG